MNEVCVFCKNEISPDSKDRVVIGTKGADDINNASVKRGENIIIAVNNTVHMSCRMNYINHKNIERYNKAKLNPAPVVKRSARASTSPYDSKTCCLFCGNKVMMSKKSPEYDVYSFVRTDTFFPQDI
ncbi:hypothetical protein SNE40_014394 [Patella caerulea]|uniref:Uncharacterized protein n=1 Tax=Patella caerulea TaxID=87958 RepID=A0AAN8JI84_PATCE